MLVLYLDVADAAPVHVCKHTRVEMVNGDMVKHTGGMPSTCTAAVLQATCCIGTLNNVQQPRII
jgi:acid phosphatase family membrane protein YuiD